MSSDNSVDIIRIERNIFVVNTILLGGNHIMFSKYFDMGYSPIPVAFKGKNPTINEWQKFCENKPTQEQIDKWDELKQTNIGITCGKASGIIVLDIDTDDKDFANKLPPSPVRRRGQKGEARFFRYSPSIKSARFPFLDVLSDGRQILVPNSIHPAGMPYVWLTPDTLLNVRPEELPELPADFLDLIEQKSKSNKVETTGRNNQLVKLVSAMRGTGESEADIVKRAYEWDCIYNNPRLFSDQKEGFKAANEDDAKKNAWKFVNSVTKSLIEVGIAKINGEMIIELNTDEIATEAKKESFKYKPYPKPRGIMGTFQELCDLKSAGNQDATGLGGSIALMAVLASNKYVTECRGLITCPNVYVINLGYSSFGKEMAQSIIHDLLQESGLLGSGNYKSDVSYIMQLPIQQERLDIIDECSSILKAMGAKEGYASNMVELMSELYTKGSTKYNGQTTATRGERYGACYNPHISFLGSTTPKGFKASVNKEVAAKGLLPRMLLFFQSDIGVYRGRKDRSQIDPLTKKLKLFVDKILKIEKIIHPDFNPEVNLLAERRGENNEDLSCGIRYKHTVLPMDDETIEAWLNLEESYHNKKCIDPEGFESAFIGRFAENIAKLALLDAISLERKTIQIDSFLWAKEVVETQWYNSTMLYELAHAENQTHADSTRILNCIKSVGIISKNELTSRNRWIRERDLKEVINTLKESNLIEEMVSSGKTGRPKTFFKVKK